MAKNDLTKLYQIKPWFEFEIQALASLVLKHGTATEKETFRLLLKRASEECRMTSMDEVTLLCRAVNIAIWLGAWTITWALLIGFVSMEPSNINPVNWSAESRGFWGLATLTVAVFSALDPRRFACRLSGWIRHGVNWLSQPRNKPQEKSLDELLEESYQLEQKINKVLERNH